MTDHIDGPNRLDRTFDALAHSTRRRVLVLIDARDSREDLSFEDLVTGDDDRELRRTDLYHTHLPKLAGAGFVRWDETTGTIRRGPAFEEIEPFLRLFHAHREDLPGDWP